MNIEQRITAFSTLGQHIAKLTEEEFEDICLNAQNYNSWFTPESVKQALNGIIKFLDADTLHNWIKNYPLKENNKKVGIVMAGNIPLVGFHDLLCVLIAGHTAVIKLSSQDSPLMQYVFNQLIQLNSAFGDKIIVQEQLKNVEAIIATGSDNTARYFEYYFAKYPNIIRKNRTSIAVINGEETSEQLHSLGYDIFQYFGLGCRNVSKVFVPTNYNFNSFFEAIESFNSISHHHKYNNNYEYNKSIYLVNNEKHLDNGFLLLKESTQLVSPISVLYFENYANTKQLEATLSTLSEKIQCTVSDKGWWPKSFQFGEAQSPAITDYADHVDTMEFLSRL